MVTTLVITMMDSMQATSECTCSDIICKFLLNTFPSPSLPFPPSPLLILSPSEFPPRWFSIVMYLVFLFAVIVVLLNLLIAQMSSTYENLLEEEESNFALARARIISRLEKGRKLFCMGKVRGCY